MSVNAEEVSAPSTAGKAPMDPARKKRLQRIFLIVGGIILLLALIFFTRWWLVGRFLEETDDAYLKADTVVISSKVSGYIGQIYVTDNQLVKAGQPLVKIEDKQYQAALDMARANIDGRKADIAKAEAQAAQQQSALIQARAQLAAAQANDAHASTEVARYAPLAASGADAPEHLALLKNTQNQMRASLHEATAAVRSAEQQIVGTQAQIQQARAQLESAQASATQSRIDARDTTVISAIDGRVGDKSVQLGQFAQPGMRMMSIIPVQSIYLIANFKETQVGRMRASQPAVLHVDALPGVDLHGKVESFSPGTGSQFALLQPENATGNFTKIVQRVPVKISVDVGEKTRQLLVPGLSVKVEVDTHSGSDDMQTIKKENDHG